MNDRTRDACALVSQTSQSGSGGVSRPTLATARNDKHEMCRFGHIAAQAFRRLACVGLKLCASARVHCLLMIANGESQVDN